ncbi:MAG: hypothetical protein JNM84_04940 [Planctomycetes bacterium]|nr:hypothetical protein [Planctomycetota bacterium]
MSLLSRPTASRALALGMLLLGSSRLAADEYLFANIDGSIGVFDALENRAFQTLGPTGLGGALHALATNPRTGTVYAVWTNGWPSFTATEIIQIDPLTGAGLRATPPARTIALRSLSYDEAAVLWGLEETATGSVLCRVDPLTGTAIRVGATGSMEIEALEWHQGQLFAWDYARGLCLLNPSSGAATALFAPRRFPLYARALQSSPYGPLYVPTLGFIDPSTGAPYVRLANGQSTDPYGHVWGQGGEPPGLRGMAPRFPACWSASPATPELGGLRAFLALRGCAIGGSTLVVRGTVPYNLAYVPNGLSNVPGVLLFGSGFGRTDLPGFGALWLADPLPIVVPNAVGSSVPAPPGNAYASSEIDWSFPVPLGLRGQSVAMQWFCFNSLSNGIRFELR